MPRPDEPTRPADRPRPGIRAADPNPFAPNPFAQVEADAAAARRLGAIEARAADIKQRFREHFGRNQELWVVREAMALTTERTFPTLQRPRPRHVPQNAFAELMLGAARHNVQARAMTRMAAINAIAIRLQAAVIRNTPRPAETADPTETPRPTATPQRVSANDPMRAPRPRQGP